MRCDAMLSLISSLVSPDVTSPHTSPAQCGLRLCLWHYQDSTCGSNEEFAHACHLEGHMDIVDASHWGLIIVNVEPEKAIYCSRLLRERPSGTTITSHLPHLLLEPACLAGYGASVVVFGKPDGRGAMLACMMSKSTGTNRSAQKEIRLETNGGGVIRCISS
ncbi:hypothetical protein LZ31DRAFT_259116 [Colletotrichum somersetense]|nr:hypothetical protein LZ31DRAFT_259116 [Colletotrichum somersetense]